MKIKYSSSWHFLNLMTVKKMPTNKERVALGLSRQETETTDQTEWAAATGK